jgi:hypothetical protein
VLDVRVYTNKLIVIGYTQLTSLFEFNNRNQTIKSYREREREREREESLEIAVTLNLLL